MADKKYKPPKQTVGDAAHLVTRAAVSAIPVVGSPAAELFAGLVLPPLEKRRQEWMEEVGVGLRRLEEEGRAKLEDLRKDSAFIDTVLQATQTAMRNSRREKLEALRNAVLNAASPIHPKPALQEMFLRYVDEFTIWHLKILDLFDSPPAWFGRNSGTFPPVSMGALSHVLEAAYPVLRGQRAFYDQVWADLASRALVNTNSLHGTMSGHGLTEQRTSELGKEFLGFIGLRSK